MTCIFSWIVAPFLFRLPLPIVEMPVCLKLYCVICWCNCLWRLALFLNSFYGAHSFYSFEYFFFLHFNPFFVVVQYHLACLTIVDGALVKIYVHLRVCVCVWVCKSWIIHARLLASYILCFMQIENEMKSELFVYSACVWWILRMHKYAGKHLNWSNCFCKKICSQTLTLVAP